MRKTVKYTGVELMESAPVGTAIIRLAMPMMIAMLAQSIFSLTDMFFIGQTGDPNMIAAVSLAFPVYMIAQAMGNIFGTGGSNYISRMLGEKRENTAKYTASVSFYGALIIGVVLAIVLWIIKDPLLWLIGVSEATFSHTDDYFSALLISMPFAAAGTVMSSLMRSEGETKKAMTQQLVGIGFNFVLNPIFILGLGWGTAGAGWATVIAQTAAFSYGVRYFMSKDTILSIKPSECKPNRKMMRQVLSIGIPSGLNSLVMSFSFILVNRIASTYGDHVVAGNGVQMRVGSLFFMLVFALVMGYQPFAGYNYGAKQFERLRKGFKLTVLYSTAVCLLGFVVVQLFGHYMISFFIYDEPTIEVGAAILRVFIWGIPILGVQVTLMVTFQALGKPIQALIINTGRQLLLYIPLLFTLNYFFGFEGFIWAQPTADIMTTGVAALMGASLFKLLRGETAEETITSL